MSLRIIYGKAGSGKSSFVFNEIKNKKNFGKIFVITPEQFSYISEKRLLETLDEKASINSEILSFNRIAHRIETEVGGISKVDLSESGKAMLVYSILSEHKKDLKFLGNSSENIDLVLRTITELKKHNITENSLGESSKLIENEYLKMKLDDIYSIYSKYQNNILDKYIDEDDKLTLLAKRISSSHMFDEAEVYIDEFAGFTAIEYEIIKEILKKAKRVSITICADNLETGTDIETDIFYYNKQVAHKLFEYSHELDIEIEEPERLEKQYRFKNDELIHLEKNIEKTPYEKYMGDVSNISIFLVLNPYSEMEKIARNIIRIS